jgi:hypothetical protein
VIETAGKGFFTNLIASLPLFIFIGISVLIGRKEKRCLMGTALFFIFLIPGLLLIYPTQAPILRYLYFPAVGMGYAVFSFLEIYVFCKARSGYKKWAVIFIISLWFVYMSVNSYTRKYLWKDYSVILNATIENGGYSSCWGWFLKGEMSLGGKEKLICFLKAYEELYKANPEKVENYAVVKQNLEEVLKNLILTSGNSRLKAAFLTKK